MSEQWLLTDAQLLINARSVREIGTIGTQVVATTFEDDAHVLQVPHFSYLVDMLVTGGNVIGKADMTIGTLVGAP